MFMGYFTYKMEEAHLKGTSFGGLANFNYSKAESIDTFLARYYLLLQYNSTNDSTFATCSSSVISNTADVTTDFE
jgi:hypothetical protein